MFISILADVLTIATPLLIAATGILIVEKSGVLNLGVEGMMIVGALAGYLIGGQMDVCDADLIAGACYAGGILPFWAYLLAVLGLGLVGMLFSLIFAALVLIMRANQVATGLGLTIFGLSLTNAIGTQGVDLSGIPLENLAPNEWRNSGGVLRLGSLNILTYMALFTLPLSLWFLQRTRAGLILRAVGENHDSAHTLGYKVRGCGF